MNRIEAHYIRQTRPGTTKHALVTTRTFNGPTRYNVYTYLQKGFHEQFVQEREFCDVNDAMAHAAKFADPDVLRIENDDYELVAEWRA